MVSAGDKPNAVEASAESALYLVPSRGQSRSLAVSRTTTACAKSRIIRTILAASEKMMAA